MGRVLVTGGAGFLGARLARSYRDSNAQVRIVGHRERGRLDGSPARETGVEFFEADLCDLGSAADAFADQDLVIHTAAMTRAMTSAERLLQKRVNVEGTRHVIEACRRYGVPRLLHVSTTAAIGISPNPTMPADESFRFNLDGLDLSYNSTKHEAEQLAREAHGGGFEVVVVNPGFMFGGHQGGYRGREVIERVLHRPVVLCTEGGLSVVHVDDVVDGIRSVAADGASGHRYILSGDNVAFSEIARTARRVSNQRNLVVTVPSVLRDAVGRLTSLLRRLRGSHSPLYLQRDYAYSFYSSDKARELGYRPRSFSAIVSDYVAWRKEHSRT